MSPTPPERRLLWIGPRAPEPEEVLPPRPDPPVAWRAVDGCRDAVALMAAWAPHLLILDAGAEPAPPCSWSRFLGEGLPAVDPYRVGGPWHRADDTPRVLPVLLLTAAIPGPADLPPAWRHRVHCQPRAHAAGFLQAWLATPLEPPRWAPEARLMIDFVRQTMQVRGVVVPLPPRTMDVLAVLAQYHPRPLMAADIVREMRAHAERRTSAHGVRSAICTLRHHLEPLGLDRELLVHRHQGYALNLGPATGSPEDRLWFWSGAEAWGAPDTAR